MFIAAFFSTFMYEKILTGGKRKASGRKRNGNNIDNFSELSCCKGKQRNGELNVKVGIFIF